MNMENSIDISKYEHPSFFNNDQDSVYCVIAAKTRREKLIAENLKEIDVPYYLPTYEKVKRYKNGSQTHELPLFDGYIFHKKIPSKYTEIIQLSSKYTHAFEVDQSDTDLFLDQLRVIKKMLSAKATVQPYEHYKEGDKVRIKSGPLKDLEGFIVTEKKRFLFVVTVDILGQSVSCEIDPINFTRS